MVPVVEVVLGTVLVDEERHQIIKRSRPCFNMFLPLICTKVNTIIE